MVRVELNASIECPDGFITAEREMELPFAPHAGMFFNLPTLDRKGWLFLSVEAVFWRMDGEVLSVHLREDFPMRRVAEILPLLKDWKTWAEERIDVSEGHAAR